MQMRIVGIQGTIQTNVTVSYAHTSKNVVVMKEKKNDRFDDIWNDVCYGFCDTWEVKKNEMSF